MIFLVAKGGKAQVSLRFWVFWVFSGVNRFTVMVFYREFSTVKENFFVFSFVNFFFFLWSLSSSEEFLLVALCDCQWALCACLGFISLLIRGSRSFCRLEGWDFLNVVGFWLIGWGCNGFCTAHKRLSQQTDPVNNVQMISAKATASLSG